MNNDLFLAKGTLHTWTGVNNIAELSAVLSPSTFFATLFDRSIGLWAQTKDPNRMTHFGFLPSTIRIKKSCFLTPTLYWLSEWTLIAFSKQQCYLKYSSKKPHSFERTVIFLFPYLHTIGPIISLQLKDISGMQSLTEQISHLATMKLVHASCIDQLFAISLSPKMTFTRIIQTFLGNHCNIDPHMRCTLLL